MAGLDGLFRKDHAAGRWSVSWTCAVSLINVCGAINAQR